MHLWYMLQRGRLVHLKVSNDSVKDPQLPNMLSSVELQHCERAICSASSISGSSRTLSTSWALGFLAPQSLWLPQGTLTPLLWGSRATCPIGTTDQRTLCFLYWINLIPQLLKASALTLALCSRIPSSRVFRVSAAYSPPSSLYCSAQLESAPHVSFDRFHLSGR